MTNVKAKQFEPDELRRACAVLDAALAEGIDPEALAYVLTEGTHSGYFRRTAR
jgi:hypothetical protein